MIKKRDLKFILAGADADADIVLECNYFHSEFEKLKAEHNTPSDSPVCIYVRDAKTIVIAGEYQ